MPPTGPIDEFLREAEGLPGVDAETVARVEEALGITFPPDYRELVTTMDGADGPVGGDDGGWIVFLPVRDLARETQEMLVGDDGNDLVLSATNGGSEGFAFVHSGGVVDRIITVPLYPFERGEALEPGQNVEELLRTLGAGLGAG